MTDADIRTEVPPSRLRIANLMTPFAQQISPRKRLTQFGRGRTTQLLPPRPLGSCAPALLPVRRPKPRNRS